MHCYRVGARILIEKVDGEASSAVFVVRCSFQWRQCGPKEERRPLMAAVPKETKIKKVFF